MLTRWPSYLFCCCLLLSSLAPSAFALPTNVRSNNYFLSAGSEDLTSVQDSVRSVSDVYQLEFLQRPDQDANTKDARDIETSDMLPPMALHAMKVPMNKSKMKILLGLLIVLMLTFVACVFVMGLDHEDGGSGIPKGLDRGYGGHNQLDDGKSAKTYADLFAIRFGEGSWVVNYRSAQGMRKEALELLFRCKIIPEEEFANEKVSQELIDEGVEIGISCLLKEKTLEEWCSNWMLAVRAFQDAQTNVRGDSPRTKAVSAMTSSKPMEKSLASHVSPRGVRDFRPVLDSRGDATASGMPSGSAPSSVRTYQSQWSSVSGSSDTFRGKVGTAPMTSPGAVGSPEVTPEVSSGRLNRESPKAKSEPKRRQAEAAGMPNSSRYLADRQAGSQTGSGSMGSLSSRSAGQSQLLARCREIMAKTDQTRVVQSTPPSTPSSVQRENLGKPSGSDPS